MRIWVAKTNIQHLKTNRLSNKTNNRLLFPLGVAFNDREGTMKNKIKTIIKHKLGGTCRTCASASKGKIVIKCSCGAVEVVRLYGQRTI